MSRKQLKEEMLKMLKSDMMSMKKEGKKDLFEKVMPKKESMSKVTVMGDSPEAVVKGLSKAQQIMQAKLGMLPEEEGEMEDGEMEEEGESEKMCPDCKKSPCKC